VGEYPGRFVDDKEQLRYAKIRYPNIAFRRGDEVKSFFFNIIYGLIWVVSTIVISGSGYIYVSPYCGLGIILVIPMMKSLLDVLMGNTVLVRVTTGYEAPGSLVYRKTKVKTKKNAGIMMGMMSKFSVLDKDFRDGVGNIESMISEVLEDNEENEEKAFAIAMALNMDKDNDGMVSAQEMLSSDNILSSYDMGDGQGAMKEIEEFSDEILLFLNSNPNTISKEIIEKFSNGSSKEDKYDPFA
jgi:ABC-type transport system involved in multi-copper enzyme maturation permease subunit